MPVRPLAEGPYAEAYLAQLESREREQQAWVVPASSVALNPTGQLVIGEQTAELTKEARADLASLAKIPVGYFDDLDGELRAWNFNRRLPVKVCDDQLLHIISNGNAVEQIRAPGFFQIPPSRAVGILLETAPSDTVSNHIRAVEYYRGESLDVALVASTRTVEPRPGDTVCGGVHLTIEQSGAVQIGAVTYRLVCSNGAMAQVCAGGRHRLRRGAGLGSEKRYFEQFRDFARRAWANWDQVASGLQVLVARRLRCEELDHLASRLRRRPFFISAQAAGLVVAALRNEPDATMYDLHNALTAVGSHASDILWRYRHRLRRHAGAFARGGIGVCDRCRQLVLA